MDAIAAERERCAQLCEATRESARPIVAPLTNAAYDEACRDCAAAIRSSAVPSTEPQLIRQRTRLDCAICTIAMALGQPYEAVLDVANKTGSFDERGMRSEYRVIEEFGLKQMEHFRLLHRGVLAPEFFLHFSWARRAILAVPSLNTEGVFHSVYWSGRALYDPCTLKTYSEWKELRPDEIILFAD